MSFVMLSDVVKDFGQTRAVDGVSFGVDRGEVVGFLGPNGAGKTTTMRLLTQFLQADSGEIEIDGLPLDDQPSQLRRRVGYLPETNPLYRDMLAGEYLSYMGRLRGMSSAEISARTDEVVASTGIEPVYYRPINQLSKGYRQRVGLAQAILSEPEILILDEPTEGLDPNQRVEIRSLIRQIGEDRTVLLSTHVMGEVRRTCSRVIIFNKGRIAADGTVDELVAGGGASRVTAVVGGPPDDVAAALGALDSVGGVELAGSDAGDGRAAFLIDALADSDPRPDIARAVAAEGWDLWELQRPRESLEDLFQQLTGNSGEDSGETKSADASQG